MSFQLPSKTYNFVKPLVQIALPAAATLYSALALIWGFPYEIEIVGTITAVATFLGVVLGVSTRNFYNSDRPYDGTMNVIEQDSSLIHQIEINTPPEDLSKQKSVNFKVNKVDGDSGVLGSS